MSDSFESGPATAEVLAQIDADGPVGFDRYLDLVLYDPAAGFYGRGGGAGRRRGDFITSPEVGPLFGAVLARYLDAQWRRLGEPEVFDVVEAGAGRGTLARTIAHAEPACATAMRYRAVERSAALRAEHPDGVESLAEMPVGPVAGVVLANELLDNLALRVVQRQRGSWHELFVASAGDELTELWIETSVEDRAVLDDLWPDAPQGLWLPWQEPACEWLQQATGLVAAGAVVVFDYVASAQELLDRADSGWLRTYRGNQRGGHVLSAPGAQDITVDVCTDQMQQSVPGLLVHTQAEFLAKWGIEELVAEGRSVWEDRAHIGDLAALRARSRVTEADALLDPNGLGGFGVLEQVV
jgi:SAM-dependent MidA family methyltransferase